MHRVLFLITSLLILLFSLTSQANAQDEKIDFKAELKKDSVKSVIKISIISGEAPFKVAIYKGDPQAGNCIEVYSQEFNSFNFSIDFKYESNLFLYVASPLKHNKRSIKIVPIE